MIPFCTSGGSGISGSLSNIKVLCRDFDPYGKGHDWRWSRRCQKPAWQDRDCPVNYDSGSHNSMERGHSSAKPYMITSHFMDEVEALCDEICILRKGKAVFWGTAEQAKKAGKCVNFEDAYLMLSGGEGEKE